MFNRIYIGLVFTLCFMYAVYAATTHVWWHRLLYMVGGATWFALATREWEDQE